jgi:malate dehydrogenase
MSKAPVTVVITGAAGNISSYLAYFVAQGAMLGPDQPVHLRLLEIPQAEKAMQGVIMELNDGALPLLASIVGTTDYKTAFSGVDIAMLVGAKPRSKGMDRAQLLQANAKIFEGQGKALNDYASRDVKVVVVGNPANTNALIALKNAPRLSARNFTAMTRLDQNRAASFLAGKLGAPVSSIRNVIVWGNHSKTMYPDTNLATLVDFPAQGINIPLRTVVNDEKWLNNDFTPGVKGRGSAIINARGKSSAVSAANAAKDHMRDWFNGTPEGEVVSMGVMSDGSYGVPKGIIFSFPCVCVNGEYRIVQGLPVSEFSQEQLRISAEELMQERAAALGTPSAM